MRIIINNNKGFKWTNFKDIWFKGYIINDSQNTCTDSEIKDLYNSTKNESDFRTKIQKLNGAFSVIAQNSNYIYACVDHIRSFPLFYYFENKRFLISDDIDSLKNEVESVTIDKQSINEFKATGYVTGSDTIYEEIKKLEPYQYLVYNKKEHILTLQYYGELRHENFFKNDESELLYKLDKCYMHTFAQTFKTLNNKTVVVPLSGGCDSRCIVILLKRLGYKNVICYSYGKEKNKESEISKKIAEELGYRWEFIEYSKELWNKWYSSNQMKEYFNYAYNGSSVPIFQDWPAVMELKYREIVPEDSVFIPGYSGDMIAGSHIPDIVIKTHEVNCSDIIKHILINNYCLYDINKFDSKTIQYFVDRVNESERINAKQFYNNEATADIIERWDYKNRQANFINNALRVYEFWGYEWRTPFWNKEVIKFWQRISCDKRINRNLYFKYDNYLKHTYLPLFSEDEKREYLKNVYYNHPLDWYGIVSFDKFIGKSNKLNYLNINAFVVEDFISELDKETVNKNIKEYELERAKIKIYHINIKIIDLVDVIKDEIELRNFIDESLIEMCIKHIQSIRQLLTYVDIDEIRIDKIYDLFNLLQYYTKRNELKEVKAILLDIKREQRVFLKYFESI